MNTQASLPRELAPAGKDEPADGLFERAGWLYAFLRVRVFRDEADTIARALRLGRAETDSPVLLEVGCGPGFYACRLAGRFPRWQVLGLDRSQDQLRRARAAARRSALANCRFQWSDALALERPDASVDGLFASRLFTVLDRGHLATVLAEMHRVLRPGGRCFLAEPRSRWRAGIPLLLLRLVAGLGAGLTRRPGPGGEPRQPTVLAAESFLAVVTSQPWSEIRCWEDGDYQYALVEKHPAAAVPTAGRGVQQEALTP